MMEKKEKRYVWKSITDITEINTSDRVKHVTDNHNTYLVHANYGHRATAVKTVDITNPSEWLVLREE